MCMIKPIPYQATWDIRHQVMWPDKPFDYIQLELDPQGLHYGLYVNEQLISIVSAFEHAGEVQFRKFATLQTHQGMGYGSKLLTYLLAELDRQRRTRVWCNARVDKVSYYYRFGFSKTQKTYIKGGIDFVVMERLNQNLNR